MMRGPHGPRRSGNRVQLTVQACSWSGAADPRRGHEWTAHARRLECIHHPPAKIWGVVFWAIVLGAPPDGGHRALRQGRWVLRHRRQAAWRHAASAAFPNAMSCHSRLLRPPAGCPSFAPHRDGRDCRWGGAYRCTGHHRQPRTSPTGWRGGCRAAAQDIRSSTTYDERMGVATRPRRRQEALCGHVRHVSRARGTVGSAGRNLQLSGSSHSPKSSRTCGQTRRRRATPRGLASRWCGAAG